MWPFRKKAEPAPKLYKCPFHGEVHGVFPTFADYTVNVRLCEKCVATMFVKACEVVEPVEGGEDAVL